MLSALMCFSRKERKDRKGVGASRPLPHRLSFVVRRPSSNSLRGGRSVSMIFAAKNAKIAKELGWGFVPYVSTLYTLSARGRISDRLKE